MMKSRKAYTEDSWIHRFVRWIRDIRDIQECKEILRSCIDRDRDETEGLRELTVIAGNALYWERRRNQDIIES